MNFRRVLFFLVIISFSFPVFCSAQDLRVNRVRPYNRKKIPTPEGMAYVPGGTIVIKYNNPIGDSGGYKQVSLSPFFMDETEVTNKQYRDFVEWVRDSKEATVKSEKDTTTKNNKDTTVKILANGTQSMLPTDSKDFVNYSFTYLKRSADGKMSKEVSEVINIYPDTKVWATDFPNSQTDMLVKEYFTNPAFDDYPVVGVTWKQARAYADWRSNSKNKGHKKRRSKYMLDYDLPCSLPTEAQWVYAAEGEMRLSKIDSFRIPRDKKGLLLANFKQSEGDYNADGSSYTMQVKSYAPNRFGLYNMYGNVAEWMLDAYNESAWAFVHDQNPVLLFDADSIESDIMKRKVVRGGSWKDNAQSLSPYSRGFEIQDVPHSYIGFRCVMPAPEILTKRVASRQKREK